MGQRFTQIAVFLGLLSCLGSTVAAETVRVVPAEAFRNAQQPRVAVSPAGAVFIVFGVGNRIHCAVSRDGGKSYQDPVLVGEAGVMSLGMRRGPQVAATKDDVVVTAVVGKEGRGKDGDVLAWRSRDQGKTWQGPVRVNSAVNSAREGLQGVAATADGGIYCVWLDLRNLKMEIFGALSTDGGESWREEKRLYRSPDGSVCPCCQPTVTADAGGGVHVMWRNDVNGARDMYLMSSKDNGQTFGEPANLGKGSWNLNLCPMDGGGLAGNAKGKVMTIWRRNKEIFRCTPGKQEVLLGRGEQGNVAAVGDDFYLAWITDRPGTLQVLAPGAKKPMTLAQQAWDPVIAAPLSGKGPVIAAWEEGRPGSLQIRAAVLNPSK